MCVSIRGWIFSFDKTQAFGGKVKGNSEVIEIAWVHDVHLSGHVSRQCDCLCVHVRSCMNECACALTCTLAPAKSDRPQAQISLPRERYKDARECVRACVRACTRMHTHTRAVSLSHTLCLQHHIFELFLSPHTRTQAHMLTSPCQKGEVAGE